MKRVSMSTVCSQTQFLPNPLFNTQKNQNSGITEKSQLKTQKLSEKQNDKLTFCNLISFQNGLFNGCHQDTRTDGRQETNAIYHKLKYRSLNKDQNKIAKNATKTQTQKRKILNQKSQIQTKTFINQVQDSKDSFNSQVNSIYVNLNNKNTNDFQNLRQFSFINNSPNHNERNVFIEKNQPTYMTNTTLSSQHQFSLIKTNLKQNQTSTNPMIQIQNFSNKKIDKNNRLSTQQSYRIKSNLQETVGSTSPYQTSLFPHLEDFSKLCESVKIQLKPNAQKTLYKSQKNVQNKSFIRSLKDCQNKSQNKKHQNLPIMVKIYDENQILCQQDFLSAQVNQEDQKITSFKTIEPEKNKSYLNRLKTLAQCGNTIVSRYNNSSQKKSRLSESSIVFQASRDVNDEDFKENKMIKKSVHKDLAAVSDGQIEMKKGNNNLVKELLNCGSFSETINVISSLDSLQEIKPIIDKKIMNYNKLNSKTFLRSSQRKSVPVTKYIDNQQVEEIRFDLDTFIQYGPL